MRVRLAISVVVLLFLGLSVTYALQRRSRGGFFRGGAENYVPVPPDATEKTEFVYARLMYPSAGRGGRYGGFGGRGYRPEDDHRLGTVDGAMPRRSGFECPPRAD